MGSVLRTFLGLLAGALLTLAVVPARAPALAVGIADQQAASFEDARLTGLPVRHARRVVPWDAMRYRWQRVEIDHWMRATRDAGMRALVTFGPSRTRKGRGLPAVGEYQRLVRAFRRRYPKVREYSPWNEPNLAVRKANNSPRRIASYYRVLRSSCRSCTVLGADVVDSSSLERWMRAYLREFRGGARPRVWGLHNYVDANSASRWGTKTMLRVAPGRIWFTETGAIVRRPKPSAATRADRRGAIRTGARRARAATQRVFTLARTSPRITRVYVYHWRADRRSPWDSALVAPNGTPRPSFGVFAAQAKRGR